jgi:hypothetical protein
MLEPRKTVDDMLASRKKETAEELSALRKKLKVSKQVHFKDSIPADCVRYSI